VEPVNVGCRPSVTSHGTWQCNHSNSRHICGSHLIRSAVMPLFHFSGWQASDHTGHLSHIHFLDLVVPPASYGTFATNFVTLAPMTNSWRSGCVKLCSWGPPLRLGYRFDSLELFVCPELFLCWEWRFCWNVFHCLNFRPKNFAPYSTHMQDRSMSFKVNHF